MASLHPHPLHALAVGVTLLAGIVSAVTYTPAAEAATIERGTVRTAMDDADVVRAELVTIAMTPTTTSVPVTTTTVAPTTTTTSTVPATTTTAVAPPAPPSTTTTTAPAPPPAPAPATTVRDGGCEASMLGWMNDERSHRGLRPLVEDEAIQHVSADWSTHMAEHDQLAHNPHYAERIAAVRPEARAMGENVGYSSGDRRVIFDQFMASPAHRGAILADKFGAATVGCVVRPDGYVWVTIDFWG